MTIITEARNATLGDLAELLTTQQAAKLDAVVPATAMRSKGGMLHVADVDVDMDENGVTTRPGVFRPTSVCDEGFADKLGMPLAYVRKMRAERPDLLDANINGWLHGRQIVRSGSVEVAHAADQRSFLLRTFRSDDGSGGIARALLSDSYGGVADNFDALTAALDGIKSSGVDVNIDGCDLTERRMYVRVSAPSVAALAPTLLAGYRSPFSDPAIEALRQGTAPDFGYGEIAEPIVFAGFIVSNSETGNGAFTVTPRLIVKRCNNGLTFTADALRSIHLGGKLDSGVIKWSADTQAKNLSVITAKARDAVATFLDVDYVEQAINRLEEKAGAPVREADKIVKIIAKKLAFSETHTAGLLDHFIRGGQPTAGGVMQAITSYAQTVTDADVAFEMEAKAIMGMELAYAQA